MSKKLACPNCDSDRIVEWNTALVAYDISIFQGEIVYGETNIDWDSLEIYETAPYQCMTCQHEIHNGIKEMMKDE